MMCYFTELLEIARAFLLNIGNIDNAHERLNASPASLFDNNPSDSWPNWLLLTSSLRCRS